MTSRRIVAHSDVAIVLRKRGDAMVSVMQFRDLADRLIQIELRPVDVANIATDARALLTASRDDLRAWNAELDRPGISTFGDAEDGAEHAHSGSVEVSA